MARRRSSFSHNWRRPLDTSSRSRSKMESSGLLEPTTPATSSSRSDRGRLRRRVSLAVVVAGVCGTPRRLSKLRRTCVLPTVLCALTLARLLDSLAHSSVHGGWYSSSPSLFPIFGARDRDLAAAVIGGQCLYQTSRCSGRLHVLHRYRSLKRSL